jgi:MFS family permease
MNRSIVSMLAGTFVLRVSTAVTGGMLVYLIDQITRGKGGGSAELGLLSGGFYATELTGAIIFGVLADRYGRKLVMLLGPLFGGIAVAMTGVTTHMPTLFGTRLLEGASTAASIPSTLGFIAAETADDEKLRGQVVSLFELVSLGGMLAIGPALAGIMWDQFGRTAFFLNCGLYLCALLLYAYGVSEVPRDKEEVTSRRSQPSAGAMAEVKRYIHIATNRRVLYFAPAWLAINAILGLWAIQAPLLLTGNKADSSQFLMQGVSATTIGLGEAILALIFGAGLVFWGLVYARFRRTTLLMIGTGAFVAMTVDVVLINHLGGVSVALLAALVSVGVICLFLMSGATPAALGLLADVSESFAEDRSAIMGLYSVFLGLGNVIGAALGGVFAAWRGIDGLVLATGLLLIVGIVALANLRMHESTFLSAGAGSPAAPPASAVT